MTDRRPHHRLTVATLALVALVGTAVPVALAWQAATSGATASDTEEVGLNRLGAATLDIEIGRSRTDDAETAPDDAALRAENLAPGDSVTGVLELRNVGSLPLRYAVTVVTDGGTLARWLLFDVWSTGAACQDGIGAANEILRTDLALNTTTVVLVGDPAIGLQNGDRLLGPDETESLCVGATLPIDSPNDAQGISLGIDLIVDAEHDVDVETGDTADAPP